MPRVVAPWTEEERKLLREVYGTEGKAGAKRVLPHRSASGIKQQALKDNLRMHPEVIKSIRQGLLKNNPRFNPKLRGSLPPPVEPAPVAAPPDEYTKATSIFDVAHRIQAERNTK